MTARDWLAKRAELEAGAPSAPWMYTEGADGHPADGPTFTALVANHPTLGEQTIAQGDYDSWSGCALIFAADARISAPAMRKALEAVLALHQPTCAKHSDGWPCDKRHPSCAAYCETCLMEAPCATFAAVTTALGVES